MIDFQRSINFQVSLAKPFFFQFSSFFFVEIFPPPLGYDILYLCIVGWRSEHLISIIVGKSRCDQRGSDGGARVHSSSSSIYKFMEKLIRYGTIYRYDLVYQNFGTITICDFRISIFRYIPNFSIPKI